MVASYSSGCRKRFSGFPNRVNGFSANLIQSELIGPVQDHSQPDLRLLLARRLVLQPMTWTVILTPPSLAKPRVLLRVSRDERKIR